jgi:hypothetical protein
MAYGQIDPARLEGDALRRWYLRSPADIEEERRRKASRVYDAFFSESTTAPNSEQYPQRDETSSDRTLASGQELDDGRWRGERAAPPLPSQYQLAAASPRGFWDYWSPRGCQNCHGYTPDTLPPIGGHSPFPPSYSPRTGGGSGDSAPPRDEWSDRPQCNQQFEADRKICQAAKSPKCGENQKKRLGHCNITGEVGTPRLKFGPAGR